MTKYTVTQSPNNIILSRWDNVNIIEDQAINLVNYLPGWILFEPFPNGGSAPVGSYTKLFSPIYTSSDNLQAEVQKVYDGIQKFISDLNQNGKTISRIDCWIEQSDDIDAVPHPNNNISGNLPTNSKYLSNQDYKFSNWVFCDIFKTENPATQTIFANKFLREENKLDNIVKKKFYTLRIDSCWLSI